MSRPRRWVVATGNPGKLAEIRALLSDLPLDLVAQSELGVAPADEPAPTFVENALLKARHAARSTGLPALADDSGLAVDALGGLPGVRSARFAGPAADDRANVARLLDALDGVPLERRTAHFYCVVVAMDAPDDPTPTIAIGRWTGRIALEPSGTGGFGYDPVFFVPDRGCTAAQLAPEVKNSISHRAHAFRRLVAELGARLGAP